jgi:transcriptional regulator of acetoin/glycerol metabolism
MTASDATAARVTLEQLRTALSESQGNVSRVARRLGVTRRTVYKQLQRYGLYQRKEPEEQ